MWLHITLVGMPLKIPLLLSMSIPMSLADIISADKGHKSEYTSVHFEFCVTNLIMKVLLPHLCN